jgi:hypothetical protein
MRLRIGGARSGGAGDRFSDRVTVEARLGVAESEDEVSDVSSILEGQRVERTLEREAAMCPRAVVGVCGRLRLSIGAVRSG